MHFLFEVFLSKKDIRITADRKSKKLSVDLEQMVYYKRYVVARVYTKGLFTGYKDSIKKENIKYLKEHLRRYGYFFVTFLTSECFARST